MSAGVDSCILMTSYGWFKHLAWFILWFARAIRLSIIPMHWPNVIEMSLQQMTKKSLNKYFELPKSEATKYHKTMVNDSLFLGGIGHQPVFWLKVPPGPITFDWFGPVGSPVTGSETKNLQAAVPPLYESIGIHQCYPSMGFFRWIPRKKCSSIKIPRNDSINRSTPCMLKRRWRVSVCLPKNSHGS